MAPTILVVGATGNTGRSVVETLPKLLQGTNLSSYHIIAQTRSASGAAAQKLAKIPGVEIAEINWTEIDDQWLCDHEVARVFIASHNEANQFAEESQFHWFALQAGVKYVVRISTTAYNVRSDCPAFYPRSHWAVEALLSTQAYKNLHWSSLQPNVFTNMVLSPVAEFIREFKKTGKQGSIPLILDASSPCGMIEPSDIGVFAAHLLVQEQTDKHNQARYVLNGPENVTGEQVIKMAEEYIGEPVKDVSFKNFDLLDQWADATNGSKTLIRAIKRAGDAIWGGSPIETTSKEVYDIYAPKRTASEVLRELVEGQ